MFNELLKLFSFLRFSISLDLSFECVWFLSFFGCLFVTDTTRWCFPLLCWFPFGSIYYLPYNDHHQIYLHFFFIYVVVVCVCVVCLYECMCGQVHACIFCGHCESFRLKSVIRVVKNGKYFILRWIFIVCWDTWYIFCLKSWVITKAVYKKWFRRNYSEMFGPLIRCRRLKMKAKTRCVKVFP